MGCNLTLRVKFVSDRERVSDLRQKQRERALARAVNRMFERSQELVAQQSVDKGTLLASGFVQKITDTKYLFGYTAPHAPYIEWGTRAHMPPVEPLIEWASRNLKTAGTTPMMETKSRPVRRKKASGWKKVGRMLSKVPLKDVKVAMKVLKTAKKLAKSVVKTFKSVKKATKRNASKNTKPKKMGVDAERAGWAIAMAIKKRGTKPRPFMRPAIHQGRQEMAQIFREEYGRTSG